MRARIASTFKNEMSQWNEKIMREIYKSLFEIANKNEAISNKKLKISKVVN